MPPDLFPKALEKANSRDQHYTRWRTFWCMIWQASIPTPPAVRSSANSKLFSNWKVDPPFPKRTVPTAERGLVCELAEFPKALSRHSQSCRQMSSKLALVAPGPPDQGRRWFVGHFARYAKESGGLPSASNVPKARAFPMMRMVVLWSLVSGAICCLGPWQPCCFRTIPVDSAHQRIGQGRYSFGRPGLRQLRLDRSAPAHTGCGFCRPAHATDRRATVD